MKCYKLKKDKITEFIAFIEQPGDEFIQLVVSRENQSFRISKSVVDYGKVPQYIADMYDITEITQSQFSARLEFVFSELSNITKAFTDFSNKTKS
jgi:hypothetical protein